MTDQQGPSHRLGKYEVLEEIGKGGFATVYRARDSVLGREVALKVLAPQLLDDEVWEARFFKEARAVARLEHPHVATIYEIAEEEGRLFIAMQLVRGGSLADGISRDGPVPREQALNIVTQVAEALDYAHGEGVFHRDLKPANVLLDERRGAVLTDFGFASIVGEHSMSLSLSGGVVGTPSYIAPEIWEGETATAQSDLYALGCILYEMVTADKAFPGHTPPAVMRAHFKPLALPETWPPGVPSWVETVLRQALAGEPGERYAAAAALVAALEEGEVKASAEVEVKAKVETRVQAGVLAAPPLSRTDSGLAIATPENIAQLLALTDPPERIWWERAEMELCLVPGGEFLMGIGEKETRKWHKKYGGELEWYTDATPQHRVALQAFYIGVTPVTQTQYARFVRQSDHPVPFHDKDWAKPYNWNQERKTFPPRKADHPVVLVSWHDAVAFCQWAGLRLPREAEWEKAASWGPGTGQKRVYPWGDQWDSSKCNSAERIAGRDLPTHSDWKKWRDNWRELDAVTRHRDTTTPVGTYSPAGDSPYGCADMAGNVWEWISSVYDPYPYQADDGREDPHAEGKRVVRGGSWYGDRSWARSANRDGYIPDGTDNYYVGFRCCVSSTSSL